MIDYTKSKLYRETLALALEFGAQLKKMIARPPDAKEDPLGEAILVSVLLEGVLDGLVATFPLTGWGLIELAYRAAVKIEVGQAHKHQTHQTQE